MNPAKRKRADWRRVFRAPLLVGLLMLCGLFSALLSEGLGRYFSWFAVGAPLVVCVWFGLRFRSGA